MRRMVLCISSHPDHLEVLSQRQKCLLLLRRCECICALFHSLPNKMRAHRFGDRNVTALCIFVALANMPLRLKICLH